MVEISSGVLMYFIDNGQIKVFLGHVGGPFGNGNKMWGIPKGEVDNGKEEMVDMRDERQVLNNAVREFKEEIGFTPSMKGAFYLGKVKRSNGKIVHTWAVEGNGKEKFVSSIDTELEWPPKSGKIIKVPEVDEAKYFSLDEARKNIHKFQEPLLDMLFSELKGKIKKKDKQGRLF